MSELHGPAAAGRRVVHRRRKPLRRGFDLRDRPRRQRDPGGARHLQRPRLRPPGDRLRLRARRRSDRLRRRRGGRTPQSTGLTATHDRRQRDTGTSRPGRRTGHQQAALLPAARRLHELRHPGRSLRPGDILLIGGDRQEHRRRRTHLQRRAERLRSTPVRTLRRGRRVEARGGQGLHPHRRLGMPDHRERGPPADGLGEHLRHARERLLAARRRPAERRDGLRSPRRRRSGRRHQHGSATRDGLQRRHGSRLHRPQLEHDLRSRRGRRRDRPAARQLPLSVSQGLRRVLRIRPHRRVQVGAGGRPRPDTARGGHHLAGMVPAARPGRCLRRGRRIRRCPQCLHVHGRGRTGGPAEQRAEQRRRRLRRRPILLLRWNHTQRAVPRPARVAQHRDARVAVPARRSELLRR